MTMNHVPEYSQMIEIYIAETACDGCGLCVDFCPVGVLEMRDGLPNVVKLQACYDCGTCVDLCPHGAIRIESRSPGRE